jgi:hypothetical protein
MVVYGIGFTTSAYETYGTHGMFKNREIMGSHWDDIIIIGYNQQHDAGLSKHNPLNSG